MTNFWTSGAVTSSPLMTSGFMYMAKSRSQALIAQASELIETQTKEASELIATKTKEASELIETKTKEASELIETKTNNIDGSWMDLANQQFTSLSSSVFGQSKEEASSPSSCEVRAINTYERPDEEEKDNLSAKLLSRFSQGAESAADNWRAVETKLKEGAETAVEDLRSMDLGKLWGEHQVTSKESMWPIDRDKCDDSTQESPSEGFSKKFMAVVETVAGGVRRSETIFRKSAEGVFDREPMEPKDVDEEDEEGEDLPPEKFLSTPSSYLLINDLEDTTSGPTGASCPKKTKKKRSSKSRPVDSPSRWEEIHQSGQELGKSLRSAVEQITPVAVWNIHTEDQAPVFKKILSFFERQDGMQTFDREPLYERSTDGSQPKAIPFEKFPIYKLTGDGGKPIPALASEPMEIMFPVPEDHVDGKEISFMGPHGPMNMQLGDGLVPGEVIKVRLAPAPEMTVEVPAGAVPGDAVEFEGPQGQKMQTTVPFGRAPGDMFDVCPPSMCIRVPEGANAGDYVQFETTDGRLMVIQVPEGVPVDQYFSACI